MLLAIHSYSGVSMEFLVSSQVLKGISIPLAHNCQKWFEDELLMTTVFVVMNGKR